MGTHRGFGERCASRVAPHTGSEEMDVDSLAAEVKRATELIASCKARLHKAEEEVSKILE